MSFLQPLMLFGLLAASIPIIIHLINKRKPRRQPFAAMEFIERSIQRVQRQWRLKRFLLLAARVLLIAALAMAAARPILGGAIVDAAARGGPERVAVVIDGSLSMRQLHAGRSAFARAVTEAQNIVDAMGPEDQLIVVLAGSKPELILPRPTGSRPELNAALRRVEPSHAHADLADAVSAAAKALAGPVVPEDEGSKAAARIVLLSDLAGHSFRAAAELGEGAPTLEVVDLLEKADRTNHAITELSVLNVPGRAPRSVEARARIRSFASDKRANDPPTPADITLAGADAALVEGSVDVVPGTIVDKALEHAFEQPGFVPLRVTLEPDTLPDDDVRFAIADVRREVRILIVDGAPSGVPKEDEIFYLERALASGAQDQPPPRVITGDDLANTDLSGFDVVVLAGVATFAPDDGARLVEFVERGGGLLISASPMIDTDLYNSALDPLLPRPLRGIKIVAAEAAGSGQPVGIAELAAEHPITKVFFEDEARRGLSSTRTRGYLLVEPDSARQATIIASYADGQPCLLERAVGKGRSILLTTTIDRELSDLPIRPAFVPLVRRTILHLGDALARPEPKETLVGEVRVIAAPAATGVEVTAPDGQGRRVTVEAGEARYDRTPLPGHYRVSVSSGGAWTEAAELAFAVNVDPRESDLRAITAEEAHAVLIGASADASATSGLARLARRGLGNPEQLVGILLLLMLGAFALESALTARRP